MRDTIRLLMVAAAVHVLILGAASAQMPPRGFEVPQSLDRAFGDTTEAAAQQARNAANSASRSLGLPEFTSAADVQRAGTRSGGPSTEPTSARDNAWLTETAGQRGRPSTAPFNAGGQSTGAMASGSASPTLPNNMRSNFGSPPNANALMGTVATVGATEDPLSPEAQLRARALENQNNAAAANARSAQNGVSSGFGSLPEGISLPTRTNAGPPGGTFGSEFARGASSPTTTPPPVYPPVYGPKTAEEANFDYSVFNSNRNTMGQNSAGQNTFGQTATPSSTMGTAQQNLGIPSSYANQSSSAANGATRSGLGMPGGAAAPTQTTLPANWTYKEIAALGKYFGVPSNDPQMSDLAFVQRLYAAYQEDQAKNAASAQLAANQGNLAGGTSNTGSGNAWATGSGANSRGAFGLPGSQSTQYQGQQPSQRDLVNSDPRYATTGMLTPPSNSQSQPAGGGRRIQLYDAFGNKIDADGNVLDENGRPVDEATKFELTYGKKLNEQMALLRKEQAELERSKTQPFPNSPSDWIASGGTPGFRDGQSGLGRPLGSASDPGLDGSNSLARSQRPSVGDGVESIPNPNLGPQADQAGLGGAAKVIGKSNPYVNVFLLCSLVANAFLFVSLHRLWYHHRDLIASSRMASSGISTSD